MDKLQEIINNALEYYDEEDRYFSLKEQNFYITVNNYIAKPDNLVLKIYDSNNNYTGKFINLNIYELNYINKTINKIKELINE